MAELDNQQKEIIIEITTPFDFNILRNIFYIVEVSCCFDDPFYYHQSNKSAS